MGGRPKSSRLKQLILLIGWLMENTSATGHRVKGSMLDMVARKNRSVTRLVHYVAEIGLRA